MVLMDQRKQAGMGSRSSGKAYNDFRRGLLKTASDSCAGYLEYPFEMKRKIYRFKYSNEVYFQLPPRGILSTKDLLSDVYF